MTTDPRRAATTVVQVAGRDVALRVRRVRFDVTAGPSAGARAELSGRRLAIGSHPSNDLVVVDPKVSRFHLRIEASDRGLRAIDTNSANGTAVNGVRVRDAYLDDGAVIAIGDSQIAVRRLDGDVEVELSADDRFGDAVGRSVAMREVFALARRAAATHMPVLLLGETGTGKDVIARAIHAHSPVGRGPFVVFDAGAVAPTLIESELFGHVRGAFTGADSDRPGVFERATGGTLFIDEIGELPLHLQPKLLRALEARRIVRVGDTREIDVHPRIVAATHRDLRALVDQGAFRSDLYYRLAVLPIEIPPLRERREDIPLLAGHFLRDLLDAGGRDPRWLLPHLEEAFASLAHHDWPGNVRELRNAIERAAALADPAALARDGLTQLVELRASVARTRRAWLPLEQARAQFDREYLRDLVDAHGGDLRAAAATAGIHPKSLERLLRRHRIRRR
ncbi:MAG: FHA domain-containing protein [Deltaproteobacteria bacterium]|nr:MAG: FHA domain-containing protein [Deltaproteobacteria bacterium]